jgi:hypothetical protein
MIDDATQVLASLQFIMKLGESRDMLTRARMGQPLMEILMLYYSGHSL